MTDFTFRLKKASAVFLSSSLEINRAHAAELVMGNDACWGTVKQKMLAALSRYSEELGRIYASMLMMLVPLDDAERCSLGLRCMYELRHVLPEDSMFSLFFFYMEKDGEHKELDQEISRFGIRCFVSLCAIATRCGRTLGFDANSKDALDSFCGAFVNGSKGRFVAMLG